MTDNEEKRPTVPPPRRRPGPGSPAAHPANAKSGAKNKKIANNLVALGSAAIVSVYGLGYARTQSAGAYLNTAAPTVAIATTAPVAASAAAPSPSPVYQSPLLAPTATAIMPGAPAGTQRVSPPTATAIPSAVSAPRATATNAPVPSANTSAGATIVPTVAAPAPTTVTKASVTAPTTAAYTDGTYTGTGTSRHGSITASVVVRGGKIIAANITQCGTRYPCSKIASLPGQVVARQSGSIDLVSGATDSSEAYQGAIKTALAKAAAA